MTTVDAAAVIWVVDDDRSVRFVLVTALRQAGWEVAVFDSADAVLAALAAGIWIVFRRRRYLTRGQR